MKPIKISSPKDLPAHTRQAREHMENVLSYIIYLRLISIVGAARLLQDGPTLITSSMYKRVINRRQIPSFIQLLNVAVALNMIVILKLKHRRSSASKAQRFDIGGQSARSTLVRFMEENYSPPISGFPGMEFREHQQKYLAQIRQPGFRIHWTSLIGFFAASGYQLQVWLKDPREESEVALPERLRHCREAH